jgi:acyl-CoA dehydrogenase
VEFTYKLSDELEMLRNAVRVYVEEVLKPHEKAVETSDHLDPQLFRELRMKAVELGLYAHNIPQSLGGAGLTMFAQVILNEEAGRTSMALADALGYLPAMICLADEAQRKWFVDPLVCGDKTVAYAMTEPGAGSDLGGIQTRAERVGRGWLLNGSKQFISGADCADYIIVLAVTDKSASLKARFTLFIVDRTSDGFHYLGNMRKMGWKGYQLGAFSLNDLELPDSHRLGEVGAGFVGIMSTVNPTRVKLSAQYVGMADECLRLGVAYANERKTFGQTLGTHQAIQLMLADCDCELEASRLLTYKAAALIDAGHPQARIAASRAKLYGSEMVGRVVDRVLQVFGGAGYLCDWPIERMYRDARAHRIGEGTSEMQRIQIARSLLQT